MSNIRPSKYRWRFWFVISAPQDFLEGLMHRYLRGNVTDDFPSSFRQCKSEPTVLHFHGVAIPEDCRTHRNMQLSATVAEQPDKIQQLSTNAVPTGGVFDLTPFRRAEKIRVLNASQHFMI